jgi:homopolymeric O-antigen transport system permease protein
VLPALPVLGAMLVINKDELQWALVALPALMAVQLLLMAGLACLVSAVTVYLRDVPNLVGLVLMLGFYVTPVYFELGKVPPEYQSILQYNPMAILLDAYRTILLGSPFPPVGLFAGVVALSVAAGVTGCLVFRRLQAGFVDEL